MLAVESGGRASPFPQAPLGTGDSQVSSQLPWLQQLTHGLSLVRWARERRAGERGGRSSPVAAPARRARPARRSRAPAPCPAAACQPGARRGPGAQLTSVLGQGRGRAGGKWVGSSSSGSGQAHHPGTAGTQVPLGVSHRHPA